MNKKLGVAAAAAIGILSGCATGPAFVATESYTTPDYLVDVSETGGVDGSGFMRQAGGGVVSCAGEVVSLLPVNDYTTERVTYIYGSPAGGRGLRNIDTGTPRDAQYVADTLTAECHVDGRFSFEDVPVGDYYAVTTIRWKSSAYVWEGGPVMRPISVSAGEITNVVLTN